MSIIGTKLRLTSVLAFGLSFACYFPHPCGAENAWRTFRGPNHNGVASKTSNPPINWSSDENIKFRTDLPGQGWSTPVIANGRAYLTAALPIDGEDGNNAKPSLYKLVLHVVDVTTGQLLDTHFVFDELGGDKPYRIHGKNSHASCTAIIDGQRIFAHFGYQGAACLDLDGNVLWTNRELYYNPVHGNGSTPILVDDRLIFTCDGSKSPKIVALDADTGKIAWQTPRNVDTKKKFAFCTPALINVNGKPQVISPASDIVMALDPKTGDVIWTVDYIGYSVIPKPIYHKGLVVISTSYDSPKMLAIDPTGSGDVTDTHLKWQVKKNVPHTASMIAADGLVYSVSDRGVAMCVDIESGEVIYKQRVGGNFSASPVLANNRIYYTDESGKTTVIRTGRDYEVLAENDLGERTLASPAVIDNTLFIRTSEALYRIEK